MSRDKLHEALDRQYARRPLAGWHRQLIGLLVTLAVLGAGIVAWAWWQA